MNKRSESKEKKPYSPPTLTKLAALQAKQFVLDHIDCSDQEAGDLLDSPRREMAITAMSARKKHALSQPEEEPCQPMTTPTGE
jgi:hypothetical protein